MGLNMLMLFTLFIYARCLPEGDHVYSCVFEYVSKWVRQCLPAANLAYYSVTYFFVHIYDCILRDS